MTRCLFWRRVSRVRPPKYSAPPTDRPTDRPSDRPTGRVSLVLMWLVLSCEGTTTYDHITRAEPPTHSLVAHCWHIPLGCNMLPRRLDSTRLDSSRLFAVLGRKYYITRGVAMVWLITTTTTTKDRWQIFILFLLLLLLLAADDRNKILSSAVDAEWICTDCDDEEDEGEKYVQWIYLKNKKNTLCVGTHTHTHWMRVLRWWPPIKR